MITRIALRARLLVVCVGLMAGGFGCASYVAPVRGANLEALGMTPSARQALTEPGMQAEFNKKPLASFPANIAVVRLQAQGYRSETAQSWGQGAYSIVTTRDVEKDEQFQKLQKMGGVRDRAVESDAVAGHAEFGCGIAAGGGQTAMRHAAGVYV